MEDFEPLRGRTDDADDGSVEIRRPTVTTRIFVSSQQDHPSLTFHSLQLNQICSLRIENILNCNKCCNTVLGSCILLSLSVKRRGTRILSKCCMTYSIVPPGFLATLLSLTVFSSSLRRAISLIWISSPTAWQPSLDLAHWLPSDFESASLIPSSFSLSLFLPLMMALRQGGSSSWKTPR